MPKKKETDLQAVNTDNQIKKTTPKQTVAKKATDKPAAKDTATKKVTKPAENAEIKTDKKPSAKKTTTKKAVSSAEKKSIVLFAASECAPFSGTGGLSDVIGSLPKSINGLKKNIDIRVISPLYSSVPSAHRQKMKFIANIVVPVSWRAQYCGLFEYKMDGVTHYFIDNEYYFKRDGFYGYADDGERFAFFSRAVLEALPLLGFKPDIIHCHDWQTALIPIYYKLFYMFRPEYSFIATVFTIHNIEYQGQFGKEITEDLFGIPAKEYMSIEYGGCINLMKGAIDYADRITTVSESYAEEIKTPQYGHGLQGLLNLRGYKLKGILNGIDTDLYNPETNTSLFKNYSAETLDDKVQNKTELQKMLGLPVNPDIPLIAIISRLVGHKGIDLVREKFDEMLKENVQFVILGTGDNEYENFFRYTEETSKSRVRALISYNRDMANKIYAAADMFLMPSRSEPCGLSQMIACRFGTVPIVRATGGLKDSIKDCGDGNSGNGFVFDGYNGGELLYAVKRAVGLYRDYPEVWKVLRKNAALTDFSFAKNALTYIEYYNGIIS